MERGDKPSLLGNGKPVDNKVMQTFQTSFVQVQSLLDQNRLLINEINQNHESKTAHNLGRNVGLIRELNNNIRRVADVYSELSFSFTSSMEASSQEDSQGKLGHKRFKGKKNMVSGIKQLRANFVRQRSPQSGATEEDKKHKASFGWWKV